MPPPLLPPLLPPIMRPAPLLKSRDTLGIDGLATAPRNSADGARSKLRGTLRVSGTLALPEAAAGALGAAACEASRRAGAETAASPLLQPLARLPPSLGGAARCNAGGSVEA